MLEQLIFESEGTLLDTVYRQQQRSPSEILSHGELFKIMEAYMVNWMIGDDNDAVRILLRNRTLLETAFPHWHDISAFVNGMIRSVEFSSQRKQEAGHGRVALTQQYSFAEAHTIVGSITSTFASYYKSECQTINNRLVALDKTNTG